MDGQSLQLQRGAFGEKVILVPSPFLARDDSILVVYLYTLVYLAGAARSRNSSGKCGSSFH